MKTATHGKVSLRELNLGHGSNNVRWLNEREDKILHNSLNSLEKARQKTLHRLQSEVQGLHHTLREHVTIRSPQIPKISNFTDTDDSETNGKRLSIVTSNINREIFGSSPEDQARSPTTFAEDLEDSTLEHIALEDSSSQNEHKAERNSAKTNNQSENAWTRKLSASSRKTALKRQLSKQLSNTSENSSSSSATLSVHRRKISVTDPPPTREPSPRLRKTYSQSSLQVGSLNRVKARSTEMLNMASTYNGGNGFNDAFMPPLRTNSGEPINRVASPLFLRRKVSHQHPSSLSSPPKPIRKISCPSKMQHFARSVHQEEVIPLQLSRDNTGSTPRVAVTMTTDLPKLGVSPEQAPHFDEDKCPKGSVSPVGLHVDGMDCTLQEKVNSFLRSLERSDDPQEVEEKTLT